ncbi:MAG: hypothetical protein AMJ79_10955 [Phycisphaerae bacterium SM23_30]|nr:MAG: hypothetical protein AMJ79_10955 [Phycisphaerae bacterium SM23_30]
MRPPDNMEKFIKNIYHENLLSTTGNKLDEKVLGNILKIREKMKSEKSSQPEPSFISKSILKNRIPHLSAVATLLAALIIGISFLGETPDGTTAAWAEMLQTMQKMPWVHTTEILDTPHLKGEQHSWRCYDPSISIAKKPDGTIEYKNYHQGIIYIYRPQTNTIRISAVTDKYNTPGPQSPFELVPSLIKRMQQDEFTISYQENKITGREVEIIHIKRKIEVPESESVFEEVSMVRDMQRNLLISMQMHVTIPETDTKATDELVFDYPQEGPRDIYELGVPIDAQIIDFRPQGDVQELFAQVQSLYDYGFGNHIALVTQSWIDEGGRLEPSKIIMLRKQGEKQRLDIYFAGDIKRFENLYDRAKKDWPDLTIDQARKYERNEATERQMVFDGQDSTTTFRISRDEVESHRHRGRIPFHFGDSMSSIAWFEPHNFDIESRLYEIEYKLITDDPNHEGLIGLQVFQSPMNDTAAQPDRPQSAKVDHYWLDPSRDYLVMEHLGRQDKTEEYINSVSKTVVLQTRQTPDGQWYPSHVRQEWNFTDISGNYHHQRIDKRIILKINPEFPEGIFKAEYIFNAKQK